ncbi:lytic transglycosylase domain-containing protein [Aeromonas sp. MdU4]|uniref:lytic transglycosylase domain-containing protein n=1 Tax=Aeromonas sp. MdU4 TaxID=3342819 RepID=UPI0035B8C273
MTALNYLLAGCVLQAASLHQLPPELVVAIIKVEGGIPGMMSRNRNNTEDLGVMQINSGAWLPVVAQAHFANDRQAAYIRLRDDACYNVQVGTWILRQAIDKAPNDFWKGVGYYHSTTPLYNQRYQKKVLSAWGQLFVGDRMRGKLD